jgi:hypothetical protein
MIELLNIDIPNPEYKSDLNYEWCGGNSIVVFTGDLIHGKRSPYAYRIFFPQEELKIYSLINSLEQQALNVNGKIIKLLGNHEVAEVFYETDIFIEQYSIPDKVNIHNILYLNKGKYLGTCGLLVKINDFIFSHAGFKVDNIPNISNIEIKTLIHDKIFIIDQFKCLNNVINEILKNNMLTDENKKMIDAIYAITSGRDIIGYNSGYIHDDDSPADSSENKSNFCNELTNHFSKFIGDKGKSKYLKLVVGHSPQDISRKLHRLSEKKRENGHIVYEKPYNLYTTPLDNDLKHTISLDCFDKDSNPRIFCIDIGMSTAFDEIYLNDIPKTISDLKVKCPQVLQINYTNVEKHEFNFSIIRSSLKKYFDSSKKTR